MDVEENEISIIINLTILEQAILNLFIKRNINLKNITANFLSSENRRRLVKKTGKKESKILGKTMTRMFIREVEIPNQATEYH